MKDFQDKVVVITGAGSGIGRATALAFAQAGARVHVVDIHQERAQQVAQEISLSFAPAAAHTVDCTDAEAVSALAAQIYQQDGRVDILHNNAGIGHGSPIDKLSLADWRKLLDINLWSVIYGVQAFLPRMIADGRGGHIINTASLAGLLGAPQMSAYCTSKFAVVGLSESLAAELAVHRIGVTVVCPGVVNTNIVQDGVIDAGHRLSKDQVVKFFQRFGLNPDRVAQEILTAVRRRKKLVVTPHHAAFLWRLKRISPPLYHLLVGTIGKQLNKR